MIRLRIERLPGGEIRSVHDDLDVYSFGVDGLVWFSNGLLVGRVVIEQREMEGPRGEQWWGNWEPVEVVEDVERRDES